MKPINAAYLALGTFIGVGVVFYQIDTPRADKCETYRVARKPVTAFVLKPPPAPPADPVIIKEACPRVSQNAENETQAELSNADETQKTRRHRRHHRWRRYWK